MKAGEEGYYHIACLFRTIAGHRRSYAQRFLEELEEIDPRSIAAAGASIAYNVRAAIMGKIHDYTDRYPDMVRTAEQEGLADIAGWFEKPG